MNNNNIIHSNTSSTGYINSHNVIYNYDLSEIKDKLEPLQQEFDYNLDNNYVIMSRVINFKDYGSNSSRTRTLVIGVRMDFEDYIVNMRDKVFTINDDGRICDFEKIKGGI